MLVRVLVVDDSIWIREGLHFMLSHAGMEVIETSDCCSAKQAAEQSDFDLVLLDIRMPGGDGFDLLAYLKATRPELPVLILSYHNRRNYVAKSHALGASGYLIKGLDNHTLLQSIRRALNRESVWTPAQLAVADVARRTRV